MKHPSGSRITRRQFFNLASTGLMMVVTSSPVLQGCSTKQVEDIVKGSLALSNLINAYRKQSGRSEIPISDKLMAVAMKHIIDLSTYHPEQKCNGNLHSWSTNGNWKGGCFDLQRSSTHPIMWDKPKEIAGYSTFGYEIAHAGSSSAADVLAGWQASEPHNNVILNKGIWQGYQWKALGAVTFGGYGCAWFGETAS